eukprot:SAG11_NODE_1615_length_4578_cov_6.001786_8_plen_99_part_00
MKPWDIKEKEGAQRTKNDCAAKERVRGGSQDTLHPRSGSRKGRESAHHEPGTQRETNLKIVLKESYREQLTVTASTHDTGEYPYLYDDDDDDDDDGFY